MRILVIGGGISGLCSALDLAIRGMEVVLVERRTLGAGTTTKCAGMLHSGTRYLVRNEKIADLCFRENKIWRKIVPFSVDSSKSGIFVVLPNYNREYVKIFDDRQSKLDITKISKEECLKEIPNLSCDVEWGYKTDDSIFNPFTIIQAYREELLRRGVVIHERVKINSANYENHAWLISFTDENPAFIRVDGIINAGGAEVSDIIALLGGKPVDLEYIHGSIAVFEENLVNRVVSLCGDNISGDVVVPSGPRTLVGSTWRKLPHNHQTRMSFEEEKQMRDNASMLIPKLKKSPLLSSFTGIRVDYKPESNGQIETRAGSDFNVINHEDITNVVTLLSGKFVLARIAAEQAVDVLLGKIMKPIPKSQTHEFILQQPVKLVPQFLQ